MGSVQSIPSRMTRNVLSLSLFLCITVGGVFSEDIVCAAGTKSTNVILNKGDSFTFRTGGKKYKKNMECSGTYQLGDCPSAVLTCTKFITKANKKCTKGDVMTVTDDSGSMKFCRKKKPVEKILSGDFSITFKTDAKKQSKGLMCTVTCSDDGSGSGTGGGGEGGNGSGEDCKCGLAKRVSRIVGGEVTEVNEYPWQAGIVSRGGNYVWCGGALISDQWVLTAAHCISNSRVQVLLGEHDYRDSTETDSIRSDISTFVNHPSYDSKTTNYDFSLLKLAQPVNFTEHPHIRPICLPADDSQTYANFAATVTGWGTTASGGSLSSKLREVTVKVVSNEECRNSGYASSSITDQMICAGVQNGGKDSCQGDSGGPLISSGTGDGTTPGQNYEHIGVVSWGYGCAVANYPGVYARTTKQLSWINSVTSGSFNTCPRQ